MSALIQVPKWIHDFFERIEKKLASPVNRLIYLPIFRVYLGLHIIKRLAFDWPYLNVLYSNESFAIWKNDVWGVPATAVRSYYYPICVVGLLLALLMILGVGRRWTVLLIFFDLQIVQRMDGFCLDGGDNLLTFFLLYLSCCNSFGYLCVNRVEHPPSSLSNACTRLGVVSMMTHVCLVYFISGWSKVFSDVWRNGSAVYYLLDGERFSGTSFNHLLATCIPFVYFSTYFTMIWEVLFPIAIFIPRIRIQYIIIGIMMHAGIYIFMMIHAFEILFIMSYGLFFTDNEILALFGKIPAMRFAHRQNK